MSVKKYYISNSVLLSYYFFSSMASAMTACPHDSTSGKPLIAWAVLCASVFIASIFTYITGKNALKYKNYKVRILWFIGSAAIWLLIVYGGVLAWIYFMFTCF